MKGRVRIDGAISEEFDVKSGVKQGCVLAPTLFGIYFSLLLKHAFGGSTEGVLLQNPGPVMPYKKENSTVSI